VVDTPELHAAPTNTRTNAQIRFLLSIFNTLVTFSGLGVIILVRKRTEGSESLCPGGEAPPVTDPPPYTTLETQQGSYTSLTNLIVDVLPRNYSIQRSGYTELLNKQRNDSLPYHSSVFHRHCPKHSAAPLTGNDELTDEPRSKCTRQRLSNQMSLATNSFFHTFQNNALGPNCFRVFLCQSVHR
jgi:hypothetical protein